MSAIVTAAISMLAFVVSPAADAASTPVVLDRSTAPGTQDPAKLRALQDINDAMEKDLDHFAGSVTDGPAKITINLAGDAASSRRAVNSAVRKAETAGIRTEVQYRKYNLRELTTLKDSIPDVEPFKALGNDLLSWGVDTKTNSVRVGVATVTPELTDKVRATFGDEVVLEQGARAVNASGRFNNLPNYLGGNRIRVGSFKCTGGFTIQNALGNRYALTAGHCFDLGTEVVVDRSNHFFGTVQFNHSVASRIDNELIGVNVYRGGVWLGPVEGDLQSAPVRSAANSCRGCQVFFDGSYTGQALATLETEGNSTDCIKVDGVTACHVVVVRGPNGARVCQPGDSGGPVFAFDGQGGVTAVGVIKAYAEDGNVCWYTRIVPILAYWQSTIYTVY